MSKEIDKLIEQVLSEAFTVKFDNWQDLQGADKKNKPTTLANKPPTKDAITKKFQTDPPVNSKKEIATRIQSLFRMATPSNVLDDADLKAAFGGTPSPRSTHQKARWAATFLKDHSLTDKIRLAAEKAFQDSDAYDAWWDRVKNFDVRSSAVPSDEDDDTEESDPNDSLLAADENIIPGTKDNIARVIYLFSVAIDPEHKKQSEAITTLETMVQKYLGGIRLVQDYIGTDHEYSQELIRLFKKSDIKKKRLPYKAQDQSKYDDLDKKDVTTTTISDPALSTGGSADAAYRQELIDVFQNVAKIAGQRSDSLDSSKFWIDSLKHIAQFSSFVKNKGKRSTLRQERMMADTDIMTRSTRGSEDFRNMTATDYLTMTVALDYCYRFAKEIEGGGGAYQFEAFLGLLAGGYVGGKERGIAGGPGEADFVIQGPDGRPIMGSAKYYASDSASQSARSFELDEGVAYVYAKKYSDETMQQTTPDALEIMKIGLHIFTIEKVFSSRDARQTGDRAKALQEGSGGEAKHLPNFNLKDPSTYPTKPGRSVFKFMRTGSQQGKDTKGELIGYYECESKGQIALKPGLVESTIVGVLDLPKVTREELTAAHQAASSEVGGLVRQVFDGFKDLMGDLTNAKKLSTQYSTSADYKKGFKALISIESAGDKIVKLSELFVKEQPKGREGEELTRMKESKSPLDSLIESIIKKKLLK